MGLLLVKRLEHCLVCGKPSDGKIVTHRKTNQYYLKDLICVKYIYIKYNVTVGSDIILNIIFCRQIGLFKLTHFCYLIDFTV